MVSTAPVTPNATGAEASPDLKNIRSDETYLGYKQATNFVTLASDTGPSCRPHRQRTAYAL
jgi:hypothetical protein